MGSQAVLDRPEANSPLILVPSPRARTKSRLVSLAAVLLAAAAIYASPWMDTPAQTRSGLPAIFGADFYAYLNLSHVFTLAGVADHDPWYGVPIQPKFGHSTFRAAFAFFAAVRSLLGNDVITSTTWSICWSTLIACSLWLLLRALFEERSAIFLFAGTSLMIFFSISTLKINIVDWLHLLSGSIRNDLPLPFIRMFFPQIAIPLLAFYFLCCKKAWDHGRTRDYVFLFLIQIATFVSFPYGAVFMGLATLIFLLLSATKNELPKRVLQFAIFGVAALLADGLYLWLVLPHGGPAHRVQSAPPLFHLDLTQLRTDFGGTVILLLTLAAILLVVRHKSSSRLLIVSIGLGNALMLLADCLIDPRFLVSHHAGYFVQISLGLELCAALCWAEEFFSPRLFKPALVAASVFFVANGALASAAAIRANAETNSSLAGFARVITGLNLGSQDLVIAPARDVDDISTAVPLLTRAHVLYTPEAEILLGPDAEKVVHERQAAYLFLSGRDANWVDSQLSNHLLPPVVLTPSQRFELQYQHRPDLMEQEIRQNILPEVDALENGVTPSVFTSSRRVVILDDVEQPTFDDSHVNRLLAVSEDYKDGPIRVRVCSAAPSRN